MTTQRQLEVTMPDGSTWAIPVAVIAQSRARYYAAREHAGDMTAALAATLAEFDADEDEVEDWAANNMNWSDVASCAVRLKGPTVDYAEGWVNGPKRVAPLSPELVGFETPGA